LRRFAWPHVNKQILMASTLEAATVRVAEVQNYELCHQYQRDQAPAVQGSVISQRRVRVLVYSLQRIDPWEVTGNLYRTIKIHDPFVRF
jgi:hypothetical protein